MTPVLNAIIELLRFKDACTINEVAQVAEVKKINVLAEVNRNAALLKINRKNGKITGFVNVVAIQREEAYKKGLTYRVEQYNWGAWYCVNTNNQEANEKLAITVTCGGLGDNWQQKVIVYTDENLEKIHNMGLVPYDGYPCKTFEDFWT